MEDATVNLIMKGAIAHNASYKKPFFDWSKTGGPYTAQMLGTTAAPSMAWINKYKDKKREIAGGISRFDFTKPAKTPNTKNKIAGSTKGFIRPFHCNSGRDCVDFNAFGKIDYSIQIHQ